MQMSTNNAGSRRARELWAKVRVKFGIKLPALSPMADKLATVVLDNRKVILLETARKAVDLWGDDPSDMVSSDELDVKFKQAELTEEQIRKIKQAGLTDEVFKTAGLTERQIRIVKQAGLDSNPLKHALQEDSKPKESKKNMGKLNHWLNNCPRESVPRPPKRFWERPKPNSSTDKAEESKSSGLNALDFAKNYKKLTANMWRKKLPKIPESSVARNAEVRINIRAPVMSVTKDKSSNSYKWCMLLLLLLAVALPAYYIYARNCKPVYVRKADGTVVRKSGSIFFAASCSSSSESEEIVVATPCWKKAIPACWKCSFNRRRKIPL